MPEAPGGRHGALLLAVLVVLIVPGCSGDADSGAGAEVALRAKSLTGGSARGSDVDRAVAILEARLDQAGIDAEVTRGAGARVFVRLDHPVDTDRVVELSTTAGVLEFYDLEANLISKSIDGNGFPVAHSLYDLLVGRLSARENDTDGWYLFDSKEKLVRGPAPTKRLLLPTGKLREGWRILGNPNKTVVLECGIGEVVCPDVNTLNPARDSFYLSRYDPPTTPELDGGDLRLEGTRSDFDSSSGEPIVVMQFTERGARRFEEITRREARSGKQVSLLLGGQKVTHHFAVVLDREIKSWPSIDWEQYPNGISGTNGAQITGIGDPQEAEDLGLVLQTGALPVRFHVESGG